LGAGLLIVEVRDGIGELGLALQRIGRQVAGVQALELAVDGGVAGGELGATSLDGRVVAVEEAVDELGSPGLVGLGFDGLLALARRAELELEIGSGVVL